MNPEQTVSSNEQTTQALVQMLGLGNDSASLLNKVIGNAKVSPQQSQVLSLLLAAREGMVDEDDEGLDMPAHLENCRDANWPADADNDSDLEDKDDEEFEALREVNDTVAAALGACRFCWGGDADCSECHGMGAPGSTNPDRELFGELVLPAVRRMRASRIDRTMRPNYGAD